MGNSFGINLEFVGKSDVFVWECVGNAQGLLGNESGIYQGVLYYESFGKQLIFVGARQCIGNTLGILTNYLENRSLVFIGNPWRISGDFWLGIHSLGEVQIQTEPIHTHAISLTKPRFPFHVPTGQVPGLPGAARSLD